MQIKVGNKWYSTDDGPIMVVLTEKEKKHIANMPEGFHRYSQFIMPDCHAIYDKTVVPFCL